MRLFPDYPDPLAQTFWDYSNIIPVPVGALVCGACGSSELLGRHFTFRKKDDSTIPWRCDVGTKCTMCAKVGTHGVVIDEGTYNRAMKLGQKKASRLPSHCTFMWREAKAILLNKGESL